MESSTITLIVCAAVALLCVVKFWKYAISAAILVVVVAVCALIFSGYKPDTSTSTQHYCTTPGGIVVTCD